MSIETYYHYTDLAGVLGITSSRYIAMSTGKATIGDVAYGKGVYMTQLDPSSHTKMSIAVNNWLAPGAPAAHHQGKTDFVIKIRIRRGSPVHKRIKNCSARVQRSIYLYKGEDLRLDDCEGWEWANVDYEQLPANVGYQFQQVQRLQTGRHVM